MTIMLIGFDSAWSQNNSGALVGVLKFDDGTFCELGSPIIVNYKDAEIVISDWQKLHEPKTTIIMLDQPIIVNNHSGQRPVENIVASPIGLRYGAVQPANTGNVAIFGKNAPVRSFLHKFGGTTDPLSSMEGTRVFETYPVLVIIALDYEMVDGSPRPRNTGRLPKYNPNRKKTFKINDFIHVCNKTSSAFKNHGLKNIAAWIDRIAKDENVKKSQQDELDACLCLLVALFLANGEHGLMVGDTNTGYIVVPYAKKLYGEIEKRCNDTQRSPHAWLRTFKL